MDCFFITLHTQARNKSKLPPHIYIYIPTAYHKIPTAFYPSPEILTKLSCPEDFYILVYIIDFPDITELSKCILLLINTIFLHNDVHNSL